MATFRVVLVAFVLGGWSVASAQPAGSGAPPGATAPAGAPPPPGATAPAGAPPPAAAPSPADPAVAPPPPTYPVAPPPPAYPVAPLPAAPDASEPTIDEGVLNDANATTNFFMPTALTPPAGTFGFHDYELFIIGASYAPTDNLLISGSTLVPLFADQPFVGLFSVKAQVVRAGQLRAALHGSAFVATGNSDAFSAASLGGVATLCLNLECSSHLSGYAAAGFARDSSSAVPVAFAGGAVLRMSRSVKFVAEADSALILGEINDVANGFLFWYGLRFTSANISGDVGFVKPVSFDDDYDTEVFPIGFPIVSFTYRSDP